MDRTDDNRTHTFLAGILLGLIAGGLLGLAYAQTKDRDARREFSDLFSGLTDENNENKTTVDKVDAFDPEGDRPV